MVPSGIEAHLLRSNALPAKYRFKWRAVLRAMLAILCAILGSVSDATALRSSGRDFETLLAIRVLATPVAIEFLSLSNFDHDASLVAYLQRFRNSAWPDVLRLWESENVLYILWSPFTDKVYAGRSVNIRRRHTDHFHRIDNPAATGQIPAYHVIRDLAPQGVHPASMYFMMPIVQVDGDARDAIVWERAFIHGWAFKLNTPRVYNHVALNVLRVLNPTKFGLRTGERAQATLQLASLARPCKRLAKATRNKARDRGIQFPQRRRRQSTFDKILSALSFDARHKAAKHGLRLLYVIRSRALVAEVFKAVGRWASGCRLKAARKHLQKRAAQLRMQLPIAAVTVQIPWCVETRNVGKTMAAMQEFCVSLFQCSWFQSTLFQNGRIKLQVKWAHAPNLRSEVRTAQKYNGQLDSTSAMKCSCSHEKFAKFPKREGIDGRKHVCARQSEIPWSPGMDFVGRLPGTTRLMPSRMSVHRDLCRGLYDLADKLKDPYLLHQQLAELDISSLVMSTSEKLLKLWEWPAQNRQLHTGRFVTSEVAKRVRQATDGLVVEFLDKNPTAFVAMCPKLFQQVADAMFEFPRNVTPCDGINFSFCGSESSWLSVENLMVPGLRKELQPGFLNKHFHRIWKASLGKREPSWCRVRIIPKNKDCLRGRPLGDQSTSPLSVLFRIMSRFLDLCLSTLPVASHWDRVTHGAFISELQTLNADPLGTGVPMKELVNFGLFTASFDVDNGYMQVTHQEIQDSWRLIRGLMADRGHSKAWVWAGKGPHVSLEGTKVPNASWSRKATGAWVQVCLEDVEPVLHLALNFMQFFYGSTKGKQIRGVMIGSNLGSALFRMVLICHEMHARLPQRWESFMTSLCLQDVTVRGIRFVDDLRVYIVAPLQVPFATLRGITYALLGFVYPPHIPFKTDHVNPTIGMDVFTRGGHLQWMAHGKALADFCCYADTMPQQIQPFFSFQNPLCLEAVALGGFHRCARMCSHRELLKWSVAQWCDVLAIQAQFPESVIWKCLRKWCRTTPIPDADKFAKAVSKARNCSPVHEDLTFNESQRESMIVFRVGRIDWKTL